MHRLWIVCRYECILCTTFALMFMSFYYVYVTFWKIHLYVCLAICLSVELKVLLESHFEHSVTVPVCIFTQSFCQYQIILLCDRCSGLFQICPILLPCCVYTGSSMDFQCFEVKPEDECLHDDKPSTGMFAGSGNQVLTCVLHLLWCFKVVGSSSWKSTWTQVWRPTCYTTTLRHSSVCLL